MPDPVYTSDFSVPLTSQLPPFDNNTPSPLTPTPPGVTASVTVQPNAAGSTSGKVVVYAQLLKHDSSTADQLVNTIAQQTIWSFTVPAGTMAATSAVHVRINGTALNNSVGNATYTFEVDFGGSTLWTDPNPGLIAPAVNRFPWFIDFVVANIGATNTNRMDGLLGFGHGVGGSGASVAFAISSTGAVAIDTTLDQIIAVKCTASVADPAIIVSYRFAEAMLV